MSFVFVCWHTNTIKYQKYKSVELGDQLVTSQIQKRIIDSGTSDGAQEEEIKALFDMIDKDKSGSLSERVNVNKVWAGKC